MVWDKNATSGALKVNQYDDAHRELNDSLETAIDLEHDFTTGGTQTGQHHFLRGTTAAQTTKASSSVDGRLLLANDVRSGERTPYVVESGALVPVTPGTDVPRIDEAQDWSAGQMGGVVAMTKSVGTGAGGIDELEWDLDGGNYFNATLTDDSIINNPSNNTGGQCSTYTIDIAQDGTGGHVLTFDTNFRAAYGAQPALLSGATKRSVLSITKLSDGLLLYSVVHTE